MEESLRPDHYKAGNMDVIAFCHHHDLSFGRGNVVKYVTRAGKKKSANPMKELEDLKKAMVYLEREIALLNVVEESTNLGKISPEEFFTKFSFEDEAAAKIRYYEVVRKREQLRLDSISFDEFKKQVLSKLQHPRVIRDFELFSKHLIGGTFDQFATQSFTAESFVH